MDVGGVACWERKRVRRRWWSLSIPGVVVVCALGPTSPVSSAGARRIGKWSPAATAVAGHVTPWIEPQECSGCQPRLSYGAALW
jgi:hypothetical protein